MPVIAGWPSSLLAAYIDEIMLPKCRTPYINGRWLYAAVKVNDLRKNKVGCCFMFSCCWVFFLIINTNTTVMMNDVFLSAKQRIRTIERAGKICFS